MHSVSRRHVLDSIDVGLYRVCSWSVCDVCRLELIVGVHWLCGWSLHCVERVEFVIGLRGVCSGLGD